MVPVDQSNRIDVFSPSWRVAVAFLNREISDALNIISYTGVDITLTEFHRGRIAAFREVLALASADYPDV